MGNDNSKNKEQTKGGTINEKHKNGSANGLSANITSNGLEIAVDGETIVQQNGEALSLNLDTKSVASDFIVIETDSKPVEAPVISENLETAIQKDEVKESKEAPTDESTSSGEEAAIVIVNVHQLDFEYPYQKAEISTQTDSKMQADISTQTGEDDDDTTTNTEVPMEVVLERVVYEDIVFRAERVEVTEAKNYELKETEPENAAEPKYNPYKSIIDNEIVAEEDNIEETIPFEVSFSLPKVVADCVEAVFATASESIDFAAVNTSDPSADEVITEGNGEGPGDMAADGVLIETAEPESNAATPEARKGNGVPSLDEELETLVMEAISEVGCEESNVTPANQQELSVPLVTVLPVSAESVIMEIAETEEALLNESDVVIGEEVVEETNTEHLANQTANQEELSVPLVTENLVKVESTDEKITTDDVVAVEDVPGIRKELDNEPLRNCKSCPVKEILIIKAPSNEPITIEEDKLSFFPEFITTDKNVEAAEVAKTDAKPEMVKEAQPSPVIAKDNAQVIMEAVTDPLIITNEELPKDTLSSPDDEVKPGSIPDVVTTDDKVEVCEDVKTDVGLERVQEAEPCPVIARDDTEVTLEAAIDALSLEFELCAITHPQESFITPQEEEVIAASTFVPLSTEQRASLAIPEEPADRAAVEMNEEAMEASSNETEAVPESVEENTTGGDELELEVANSEELVEENDMAEGKTEVRLEVMAQTEISKTPEQIPVISVEPALENPNPCQEDATMEVLENILESVAEAISVKPKVTENTVKEPADVPATDTTEESMPCVSAQLVELVEENVTPAKVLLKDTAEGTAVEVSERIEQTDSALAISNDCVVSLLEQTLKSDMRVVIVKTIEVREDITEEILQDHTGAVLTAIEENPKDATLDECSEAVLDSIVEEIIREHVAAEFNLMTSEEVAPEGKTEENESSVNSMDSTTDSQSVTSTDMEALVDRLQSACVSVVEESVYSLGGLQLSSLGHRVTVDINVAPKEEQM
ncbi:breast carcinoma-amplified sequence 1 isoform X2 [Epinephelus moara]|uniref:breast carcinoma-amplified sequence 1 isoform X2 n=1 Tax=Epinephelus moara TaxID=300413 RepID=UPI00214ECC55|nr:breast carcinoma-amplified sequence 1 isoform X2 [Epinephelus moara]